MSGGLFRQGLRFVVVGLSATLIYAIVAWLLTHFTNWRTALCSLIAFFISGAFSYLGHRLFTFRSRDSVARTAGRFAGVNLLAYCVAGAIPWVVSDIFGFAAIISIALVCIVIPVMNFALLNLFVFKSSSVKTQDAW